MPNYIPQKMLSEGPSNKTMIRNKMRANWMLAENRNFLIVHTKPGYSIFGFSLYLKEAKDQ